MQERSKNVEPVPRHVHASLPGERGLYLVTTLALAALCVGPSGCSKADSAQGAWPNPQLSVEDTKASPSSPEDSEDSTGSEESSPSPSPGSEAEDDPESGTSDSTESSEEEKEDVSSSDATEASDDSSTSQTTQEEDESTPSTSSEQDASSSSSASTGETSSSTAEEDSGTAANCEQELCLSVNADRPMGSTQWSYGPNMFWVKPPAGNRRLARVEFVEGFASGTTRLTIRSDKGESSDGILRELSWSVDLPQKQAWAGADLEEPLRMYNAYKLWFVIEPIINSRASFAASGNKITIWHRPIGSENWREAEAPLMFRAYCCKE